MHNYSPMLDRVMANEILSVSWSSSMDVCAILYANNQLEMCRVGEQLQRMFIVNEEDPISNVLVEKQSLFYTSGKQLYIYHLASHQKIIKSNIAPSNERVIHLALVPLELKEIKETEMLSQIIPLSSTNIKNWQNLCFLRSPQSHYMLVTSTQRGVSFNFNGIFPLLEMPISNVISIKQIEKSIYCFTNKEIKIFDLSQLLEPRVLNCAQQLAYLNELISFLKTSILGVNSQLQEIFKTYQLNILSPLQLKDQPINVAILQFYQQGICPNELVQFFQKELYNTKILQKMDDKISASFNTIQEILQDSLLNVLTRITISLNYFIANYRLPSFCLADINPFKQLQAIIRQTIQVFSRFQMECHESKIHLRNFFVWLNQCAIKAISDQEAECENINSPLNKMELNLKILYQFLQDEHIFNLKHLQCYYSEKVPPKTFLTNRQPPSNFQVKHTENVTKCLQSMFKGLYREVRAVNQIDCEDQFVPINALIRQIQNLQEQLQMQLSVRQLRSIALPFEVSEISTNMAAPPCFVTIKDGKAIEMSFDGEFLNSYTDRVYREGYYYQGELVLLAKSMIKHADGSQGKEFECQSLRNLQISQRGLISVVQDGKKLVILSL